MRERVISEFCEGAEKILKINLYGIILYGDPEGDDIDVCVVPYSREETQMKELRKFKGNLEDKYDVEFDALYLPPHVFSEGLSRMTSKLGKNVILGQLRVLYGTSHLHHLILRSIINPIDKPPMDVDNYRI